MKKRVISLFLLATMLLSLCAGCGEKSKITENKISYKYDQELNIVDDNYRNYYEIFVGSFYDSDGNGMGDLQGIIQKLDYIEYMGFNGIWMMPIMQSPSYHKYDVSDYMSVDYQYGTIDDFKALVEACHEKNINVVIDMVINHSSTNHKWFTKACQYLKTLEEGELPNLEECPYVGYYHFVQERLNDTYYSVSGSEGWYYEGSFSSGMPDLNLDNEALRAELETVADFWLELGVDGFRMDAAMHFTENAPTTNNEVLNWLYTYCKEKNPDFYMVSEVWAGLTSIAEYYNSKTPSMFNFDCASAEGILAKSARGTFPAEILVDRMISYQSDFYAKNSDYIDAPFLSNHDQVRISNSLNNNEEHLKMAAGMLLMMNGSPFVYYGEEIGMASKGTKDENKRIPMFWSATDTTGATRGPSDADKGITSAFEAVDEQLKDGHSLLNYYKRALRLRNENPEIARGEIVKIDSLCEGNVAVLTKNWEGSTIAIIYNNGDAELTVDLSGSEIAGMGIRGYLTLNGEEITLKDDVVTMPKKSICILK